MQTAKLRLPNTLSVAIVAHLFGILRTTAVVFCVKDHRIRILYFGATPPPSNSGKQKFIGISYYKNVIILMVTATPWRVDPRYTVT